MHHFPGSTKVEAKWLYSWLLCWWYSTVYNLLWAGIDWCNLGIAFQALYLKCNLVQCSFIFCPCFSIEQGAGASAVSLTGIAQRARHPDELKCDDGKWIIDIEYYLSQQIHPVVSRLCASIQGTSPERLADCLGLDSSKVFFLARFRVMIFSNLYAALNPWLIVFTVP